MLEKAVLGSVVTNSLSEKFTRTTGIRCVPIEREEALAIDWRICWAARRIWMASSRSAAVGMGAGR